jgi:hypothetical protein
MLLMAVTLLLAPTLPRTSLYAAVTVRAACVLLLLLLLLRSCCHLALLCKLFPVPAAELEREAHYKQPGGCWEETHARAVDMYGALQMVRWRRTTP